MKHHKPCMGNGRYLAFGVGALLLTLLSPLKAQQVNVNPQSHSYRLADSYSQPNYLQDGVSQQASPCRQLAKKDTVVIIEASNSERMQKVNQVVSQHKLKGDFCTSRRTGRTVWMSRQISNVDTAVKVFDYFRGVGLVSPINPNGGGSSLQNGTSSPYPAPSFQSPGNSGTYNPSPSNRNNRPQYGNYSSF